MALSEDQQLHFVFIPQKGQGHLIPMIDMAKLFAQRGVIVTIVTVPSEAEKFKSVIDRAVGRGGLQIRLLQLEVASAKPGLFDNGHDKIVSQIKDFFNSAASLQQPFEQSFRKLQPTPSCIISDIVFYWTSETAIRFRIPRVVFDGFGCCSRLCHHNILHSRLHRSITSDSEPFIIPGLPDEIEITKGKLPMHFHSHNSDDEIKDAIHRINKADETAYGVMINSFRELEPNYAELYRKAKNNKAWCIGPVSLCNKETVDKAERGNKASIDGNQCLKWLDSKEPSSVVYACFGSFWNLAPSEIMEIGLGLESSGYPFIWVIGGGGEYSEIDKLLTEDRFAERNEGRGLVIKGWAPQVLILSHRAIGGFLTHCGWNSTLEGVCAGVPLLTWPMGAEQFLNENLVVRVLKIGVKVAEDEVDGDGAKCMEEERMRVGKKKDEVEKAVKKVMDGGEEGEERRKRARELGEKAKKAMEEGGSSHFNMTLFMQDMMHYKAGSRE
ncbi:hypothetical protein MKW94_018929 [Papaver nudicaule]|uniref:Glycosyltransferase n=1 Tax=Papaver nudicaule TaxID=74823 RepID=A0AA41RVF8_PAPNU|nr:hypothetical protein [Papaver nudicaule]